jgi:hypothetical protein
MKFTKSLKAIALVSCLLFASTANAKKINKPGHMTDAELDRELASVLEKGRKMEELQRLYRIGANIKNRGRCNPHWTDAKNTYAGLERLNGQYQGRRLDRNYRQQNDSLRATNIAARTAYGQCFTAQLKRRKEWMKNGITSYNAFTNSFTNLSVELSGNTSETLKRRAEELFALKEQRKHGSNRGLAQIEQTGGDVQIVRSGKILRLRAGQLIQAGDKFATGPDGELNIIFHEIIGRSKTGPFRLDMGPNSRVTISKDSVTNLRKRGGRKKINMQIGVERGTIRLSNAGIRADSSYTVVAGKFTAIAPGSDMIVSHFPRRSIIDVKLQTGVADLTSPNGAFTSLRPPSQVTVRRGVVQNTRPLPYAEWVAAIAAAGASPGKVKAPPPRTNPGGEPTRADVVRRQAARVAVDRMLKAMNRADGNGLLTATTGQAQQNARNSMRNSSLADVLRRTGRPIQWRHDCVACTGDGYCAVPAEVIVDGGPGRYDAMHIVKPANGGRNYTVDRIDAWDENSQKFFRNNRPLCNAEIKAGER